MSELYHFYLTTALMLLSGGLGWYMRGRGMAGVMIDLANTKNELEKVKTSVATKIKSQKAPSTPSV